MQINLHQHCTELIGSMLSTNIKIGFQLKCDTWPRQKYNIPPSGCNTASNAWRRSLLCPTPATNWQQNVLNIWKISLHITAWRLTTWALQMSSRFSSLQSPADPYNVQTGCIWKKNIYFSPCLILILYIIFCHETYHRRRKICFLDSFYLGQICKAATNQSY